MASIERFVDVLGSATAGFRRPSLPEDEAWRTFRRWIRGFHRSGYRGAGQVVAVIDSGFLPDHPILAEGRAGDLDLTGEGIRDRSGHGSVVSLLILAVAPEARLFHIKVLSENGYCAGGSAEEREKLFVDALEATQRVGARVVNISAGVYRDMHEDKHYFDPTTEQCKCRVCERATAVTQNSDAVIIAAAGNIENEVAGRIWACPACAPEVVAVVGVDGTVISTPLRSTTIDAVYAPMATSAADLESGTDTTRPLLERWRHVFWDLRISGSSFAAPLVAGSASLVTGVFGDVRPRSLFLRNSCEYGVLDLQDILGRELAEGDDRSLAFRVNVERKANEHIKRGELVEASKAFCLLIAAIEITKGENDPALVFGFAQMGRLHAMAGSYQEASYAFRRALGTAGHYKHIPQVAAIVPTVEAEYRAVLDKDPQQKAFFQAFDDPLDDFW